MKTFFKKILFLSPLILSVCCINYFIDPANLYTKEKYEKGIALMLLKGKNVANIGNFNDRVLQKHYIEGLKDKKDIIVLGSSTSQGIGAKYFPGKTLFNHYMTAAGLGEDMAIYWMYRKRDKIPSVVILGLDPWILNRNNGTEVRNILKKDANEISDFLGISQEKSQAISILKYIPDKYYELISPSYFQNSVKLLLENFGKNSKRPSGYYETINMFERESVKLADGSENVGKDVIERDVSEARQEAVKYATNRPVTFLENYKKIDKNLSDNLNSFIKLLKNDGVEIIIYLPPYHPQAYEILINTEEYRIIKEAEAYLRAFARENNIRVIGSYNPDGCLLQEDQFYDQMHIKNSGIDIIFS